MQLLSLNFILLEMPRNKISNKLAIKMKMRDWYNLSPDIFSYVHKLHSCRCRFLSLLTISKIKKLFQQQDLRHRVLRQESCKMQSNLAYKLKIYKPKKMLGMCQYVFSLPIQTFHSLQKSMKIQHSVSDTCSPETQAWKPVIKSNRMNW